MFSWKATPTFLGDFLYLATAVSSEARAKLREWAVLAG